MEIHDKLVLRALNLALHSTQRQVENGLENIEKGSIRQSGTMGDN